MEDGSILWAGTVLLLLRGCGGTRWDAISAARPWRDFPRALMKMSAAAGCFIVPKETKMIFARSICECQSVSSELGDQGHFVNSLWLSS